MADLILYLFELDTVILWKLDILQLISTLAFQVLKDTIKRFEYSNQSSKSDLYTFVVGSWFVIYIGLNLVQSES